MINLKSALIASALVLASASSALAGGGTTTNTTTTGWERGSRNVNIKNSRVEHGSYDNSSFNVKADTVGENAGVRFTYDNGDIKGSGFANNIENPDPFWNIGEVSTREVGSFVDVSNVNVQENVEFGNNSIQYSLDASY